jgi:hypothetical protein
MMNGGIEVLVDFNCGLMIISEVEFLLGWSRLFCSIFDGVLLNIQFEHSFTCYRLFNSA